MEESDIVFSSLLFSSIGEANLRLVEQMDR